MDKRLSPTIVLRYGPPATLSPLNAPRPERHGRAGLLVLLTDGSSREITYGSACDRRVALAWVLTSARVGQQHIAAVCDWSADELWREEQRIAAAARRAAAEDAELEALLGSGRPGR